MSTDPIQIGREHLQRGDQATKDGDLVAGRRHYSAACAAFRSPASRLGEAHALKGLAAVTLGEGTFAKALSDSQRAQEAYEGCLASLDRSEIDASTHRKLELDAKEGMANALLIGSDALSKLRRDGEAEAALEQARSLFHDVGGRSTPAALYIASGRIAMRNGQMKDAEKHMRGALNVFKLDQDRTGEVSVLLQMAELHRLQLKLHKAEEALNLARSIVLRMDEPNLQARVWMALGSLHLQAMRLVKARAAYQRALPIFRETGRTDKEGFALMGLGEVESRDGDPKALHTVLAGAACLVKLGSVGGFQAAMLRVGEHGLRVGDARLALLAGECARRFARDDGQVLLQGQAMRIIVKALVAQRESRATLVAALAREAVAGSVQQNAVDVAEYYRRRAPKQILAELDALSTAEMLTHSERLVCRVLGPVLATVGGELSALNQMEEMLALLTRMAEHVDVADGDAYSEELTHEEDARDFATFDSVSDPPSEGGSALSNDSLVEVTDGAPPIRPNRTTDILDVE